MRAGRWVAIGAVLLASGARAEDPPAQPPHAPGESQPAEAPPALEPDRGWIDESHAQLEQLLGELALRLDDFFGEERRLELERPVSALRWRNELRTGQDRRLAYRSSVRASLYLPGTARWLSQAQLVIAGETGPDRSGVLTEEVAGPSLAPSLAAERASLELRVYLLRAAATNIDVGAGLRVRVPPEPYLRLRLRRRQPLLLGVTARLTPSLFWQSRDGFGTSANVDLDRPLGLHTVLRWSNQGTLTEVTRGVAWASEISAAHEVVALRTALAVGAGANGHTRPAPVADNERLFVRARRDLWRRWLFVELEPEVAWPLDPVRGRERVLAATLRVEVHFDGRSAPGGEEDPPPAPGAVP
jgi:hypothetical protein